jgi:hypothetical protein
MIDKGSLNCIYIFKAGPLFNQGLEGGPRRYHILEFFNERGRVDVEIKKKALQEIGRDGQSGFDSLDELEAFSLKVCELMNAHEVYLLSTQDYNAIVEQVNNVRGFREIFKRYGNCLTNQNFKNKTGLFSKLFS